ncbi:MAG: hypothetical protein JW820_07805 [Spirochaetales bacterium]|nr:hypothetical protein [Spirochaetales bacterium]
MNFSFGNLLAIFIVLIILIIYRQLDRNNRSLEKVKKYSDKIKDDIGALVEQKTAAMKDLAIELEVNLKTGKEVLRRVRDSEEALAQRAKGIDEVRVRLDGYDKTLEELVSMTARVEDNLKRVQSESLFVDKVGRRIAVASEGLERIEQGIGKVEERFRKENLEQLAAVREEVFRDSEQRVASLAEVVSGSEQRIKDYGTYVTRLEARGQELERQVMERLTKGCEQVEVEAKSRRAATLNQFVASLNKLLGDADSRSKVLKKNLVESVAEIEGRLVEHQKRLEEAVKRGESLEGKIFAGLKEQIAKDAAAVRQSSEALHQKLEESKTLRGETAEQMRLLQQETARVQKESLENVEKAAAELEVAALAQVEKQLEGFEKQIDYRFQKLEAAGGDIEALEKNLRELADSTAARVREEFAEFTRSFAEDRSAERARVEEELGAIRGSMGELEDELTGLKAKAYENVSAQLQVFEDEFFKDLRERNQAIEARLRDWQSELENKLEQVRAAEVRERASLEKRFSQEIEKELEAVKHSSFEQLNGLGSRVAAFEGVIDERLGESEARAEELTRSVTLQIERSRQELDIAYQKQLDGLKDTVNQRVQQITREAEDRLKGIESALGSSKEEIMNVSERITELQRNLAERSEGALEQLQKELDGFDQEFSRRTAEFQSQLETRLQEFRGALSDMKDRAESTQGALLARMEEGSKVLSMTLADLDKRVKSFVAQTKIFERADDLKVSLEGRIEDMKRDMEKLQSQRKEMEALETRIAGMRKSADEVGGKLGKLLSERARLDDMDSDFKKLLAISKELDHRIETVYSSQDAVQEIQAKIRQLAELEKATEGRFERLEKKKAIVEATTAGVDKSFEQLGVLEKDLGSLGQEVKRAGGLLETLKTQTDALVGNQEKATYVSQKILELDGILGDLEQRMQKLETAREWLAKTETRFEHIGKQAQEQVRLLESILKAESKQSKLGEGAPPMDKRETVIKLAHLGWSPVEIARTTKLSRGEVELILELAPKA